MGLRELGNSFLRKTGLNENAGIKFGEKEKKNKPQESLIDPKDRAVIKTFYNEAKKSIEANINAIDIAIKSEKQSETLIPNVIKLLEFLTAFISELDKTLENKNDQEIEAIRTEMLDQRDKIKNKLGELNS